MITAQALDGETLDQICWRILGRTQGVTEQALTLNPGLADLGPALPGGTPVQLPDLAQLVQPKRAVVNLWD